jgi:LmbE family N-acetylglucosaminyl deacetylase
LYFTREPNYVADVSNVWEEKIAAVRCYEAQFDPEGMDQLVMALDRKSQQVAQGQSFARGEPLKVLHTSALHCGI